MVHTDTETYLKTKKFTLKMFSVEGCKSHDILLTSEMNSPHKETSHSLVIVIVVLLQADIDAIIENTEAVKRCGE